MGCTENTGTARAYKKNSSDTEKVQKAVNIVTTVVGTGILLSMAYNIVANSDSFKTYSNAGKSLANLYLKTNGTKKVVDFAANNKSWADYAWEEIEKSHRG